MKGMTSMFELDPHTHSIASGHAGQNTITDLAKQAKTVGLKALGLTDHGPTTPGSSRESYFRNLAYAPKKRCGIEIFYGVELNILDYNGSVDLDDVILEQLDYAIISMHLPNIKPGSVEENTFAYVNAMKHPKVKLIGHPEDTKYPIDFEALVVAAKHCNVAVEINNSSLSPNGYRGDVRENVMELLHLCKKYHCPIMVASDAHKADQIGNFQYALNMINECDVPLEFIMNRDIETFKNFIKKET
jgi:putative hydrolase